MQAFSYLLKPYDRDSVLRPLLEEEKNSWYMKMLQNMKMKMLQNKY